MAMGAVQEEDMTILKIILGSIARHWFGAALALIAARIGLQKDDAGTAVESLSNDMVFNALLALSAAIVPAALSIWSRLKLKLRERVALLLHSDSTESEVKAIIAEAPAGERLAAVLTADPTKIEVMNL